MQCTHKYLGIFSGKSMYEIATRLRNIRFIHPQNNACLEICISMSLNTREHTDLKPKKEKKTMA